MNTEHRPLARIEAEGLALEKPLASLVNAQVSALRAFDDIQRILEEERQRMVDLKREYEAAKVALSEKDPKISDTPKLDTPESGAIV